MWGVDSSTGDSTKVYNKNVVGKDICGAMGPEGMSKKATDELFETTMDVTALPGTCTSKYLHLNAGQQAEVNGEIQVTTAIVQAISGSTSNVYDATWKQMNRHGLRLVKNGDTLEDVVSNVYEGRDTVFEAQANRIRVFMSNHYYNDQEIEEYLHGGLLSKIIQASWDYYYNLLVAARELNTKHHEYWATGPAFSMLKYHSDKLQLIQMNSDSRQQLILYSYGYLQDATKKP